MKVTHYPYFTPVPVLQLYSLRSPQPLEFVAVVTESPRDPIVKENWFGKIQKIDLSKVQI